LSHMNQRRGPRKTARFDNLDVVAELPILHESSPRFVDRCNSL
jgi:hypothetical protein